MKKLWGYGSVGRASRSQREGQRFESAYLHHKSKYGRLAQLVEQLTLNQWAQGSSP